MHILAAATLCAALYGGYVAYDYATMTEQERMFLANVEALTKKEYDLTIYNVNMREAFLTMTADANIGVGGTLELPNGETIKVGVNVNAGATIRYPDCVDSEDNICKKEHIYGDVEYL